ncbi:MAG: response regulator transcription factor [Armatimonadetes bacterium]|nr:response regulator transcription factor [Armatimonadota bacterium]
MAKILLIEDEKRLAATIAYNLKREGHLTVVAKDGESGLQSARQEAPDLILLDLMLPKLSGLQICRVLRAESEVPILILTAKDSEADKVAGLELGADDYVTKPFSMRELVARVGALLRRSGTTTQSVVRAGDLRIDLGSREVFVGEASINLSRKEFELLAALARCKGRPVSRRALLDSVWNDVFVGDHTLEVHIRWLREKLETDPSQPRHLLTIRGFGYKLQDPANQ